MVLAILPYFHFWLFHLILLKWPLSLLPMSALSDVELSTPTQIHNAIFVERYSNTA